VAVTGGGNDPAALAAAFAAQRQQLDALRENMRSLQESALSFREQLREFAPSSDASAVSLTFDRDGVLAQVDIAETELSIGEQDLIDQLNAAFATAPLPQAVVRRFLSDPAALAAIRDRRELPARVETQSADRRFTLVTQLGRPTEIRAQRVGALLEAPRSDVAAEVVRLARLAAAEEENPEGAVS
jgi:hypothetical protein